MKGAVYLKDKEGLVCEADGDKPSSWVPGKVISMRPYIELKSCLNC